MIFTTLNYAFLLGRSSDSRPIVWCVIGVLAGLYIFYNGFRLLQRRHLILDTPVSKIRSASLGMVELNGLAVGPYTMVAPITERPCYYYRTVAWEWKQCGKNKQWVKVAGECMHLPFFLDDNTGKVMVDPRGAELDLHRDFRQEFCDGFFTTKQEAPPAVHRFLANHGVMTTNKIKIEEFCIKPKNSLFVLGTLHENPGLELTGKPIRDSEIMAHDGGGMSFSFSLRSLSFMGRDAGLGGRLFGNLSRNESEDERLLGAVLSKPSADRSSVTQVQSKQVIQLSPAAAPAKVMEMTQQQKVAAALVKAGITNPAAWAAAGVSSSPAVVQSDSYGVQTVTASPAEPGAKSPTTPEAFELRPRVVLMRGENNPTFLISWQSQRDIARSLGWKCTLMIWGGPALTILCLYALHNMTNWF